MHKYIDKYMHGPGTQSSSLQKFIVEIILILYILTGLKYTIYKLKYTTGHLKMYFCLVSLKVHF